MATQKKSAKSASPGKSTKQATSSKKDAPGQTTAQKESRQQAELEQQGKAMRSEPHPGTGNRREAQLVGRNEKGIRTDTSIAPQSLTENAPAQREQPKAS